VIAHLAQHQLGARFGVQVSVTLAVAAPGFIKSLGKTVGVVKQPV
jgi:hypothetical protein